MFGSFEIVQQQEKATSSEDANAARRVATHSLIVTPISRSFEVVKLCRITEVMNVENFGAIITQRVSEGYK